MIKDIDKYKDLFLSEAKEHISSMNKNLLLLEKDPDNLSFINEIFRGTHTLKSMAATMGYDHTANLCHSLEDVLDSIKHNRLSVDMSVDLLFESFDNLETTLKKLKENGTELDTKILVKKLQTLNLEKRMEVKSKSIVSENSDQSSRVVEKIESIEVKVERLDSLMNLAEELLIARMRLDKIKEELQNPELTAVSETMSRLITEMQYNVMQSRMVPIGFIFNRYPRMVRDLAKQQGKQVALEMKGTDIELDRSVIDEIGESLLHLLRNSIDHGIEKPGERKASGKPLQGTIRLNASRVKNSAIIELSDDGAGLNYEQIKNIGMSKGIFTSETSREEIINSIFTGLSTTKKVTQISGRGFGLNIVKNKIASIGGSIKVESNPEGGTSFIIEVPLTLAIIKSLFVEVGEETYAIPMVNIERLTVVDQDEIKGMLQYEAIILDDEDIPLTRLDVLFGKPSTILKKQPVVIINKGRERLGLAVDAFLSTQEMVIKPLNKLIRRANYFSGTTIIGSGKAVLILDVESLIMTNRIVIAKKRDTEI